MLHIIYKSKVSPKISSQVSKAFLDKISFTFKVPKKHHTIIEKRVQNFINCGYAAQIKTGNLYKLSCRLFIGDPSTNNLWNPNSKTLFIECGPVLKHTSFLRIEFNPSKGCLAEIRHFIDSILDDLGGYEALIQSGTITRRDITIDVSGVPHNNLLVAHKSMQRKISLAYYRNGEMETAYIGNKSKSRQYYCVYNKSAEVEKKSKKEFPLKKLKQPTTRIEYVSKMRIKASLLSKVANPFLSLLIVKAPKLFSKDANEDLAFQLFWELAKHRGLHPTFQLLPKKIRKKYKQLLASDILDFDPADLWSDWKNHVQLIFNPPILNSPLILPAEEGKYSILGENINSE